LSTNKSDLLNKLSNNYPNFIKKDLQKLFDIFIYEMNMALKRGERVELRDIFTIEPKIQKSRYGRNPKTNEKVFVKEKISLLFKMSKLWSVKINEKI
tara:strand:+ start:544 stop:834 length:291 start_codon:yes stop_codon:yes gene_type:complete